MTLALALAGLAPGLEFYSVLAANIAVTPGTSVVQTGPVVPVTGPSALGNGSGLTQSDLGVQAANNLQGRSLSGNLPGASHPSQDFNTGSITSESAGPVRQAQLGSGSAKRESALASVEDARVRSAGRENLPSQTEVSPAVVNGAPAAASRSAERLAERGKRAEEKVLALAAAFQSRLPSQAVPSGVAGKSSVNGLKDYIDDSAFGPDGIATRAKPKPTERDPFGRDIGWDKMPAEPAEAPTSIEQVSLDIPPGAKYTPSPEDWRDEVFYAAILDRFARSEPYTTWGDPADGRTRHGGNIRGLMGRLDYLKGLGITTVLINPILMNPPSGSHGYWAANFLAVDPQIGTLAEFKQLVAEAHKRGMRIVLDMVFNHTGPIMQYEGGYKFGDPKPIKNWDYPLKPVELAREEHFSRRGDINDWHDPEQIKHGDLPGGINHLNTENPATQDILLKIGKWWIKQTDVDGFRLDVYKHVAPSFWSRFFAEIREYAGKLGKKDFLLVGELYDGDANNIAPEVGVGRLSSAYNYPSYYWDSGALHGDVPTRYLEGSYDALKGILGDSLKYLVRFLDNHDRPHFLRPNDPLGILGFALAFTMLSVGIPYIYYGDEQAFRQVPEHAWLDLEQSREDMFPGGKFRNPGAPVDGFNTSSPMYKLLSAIAAVRKAIPALRRGEQYVRWSDPDRPGIFAFSRIFEGQEVVVVLNSSNETRTAEMWVDADLTPVGAGLVDKLDSGYSVKVHSPQDQQGKGSKVTVEVPAYGARILVRKK